MPVPGQVFDNVEVPLRVEDDFPRLDKAAARDRDKDAVADWSARHSVITIDLPVIGRLTCIVATHVEIAVGAEGQVLRVTAVGDGGEHTHGSARRGTAWSLIFEDLVR